MWQYDYSYLQHGINGFKYIDKFLSKAGNWVYVYKDKAQKALKKAPQNVTSKLNTLKNKAEEIYTKVTKNNKYSPTVRRPAAGTPSVPRARRRTS